MVNIIGYIYVTTGIKRSFFYIGKHVSDSFDPTYFGSGIKLRSYINKYKNDFTNVGDLVRTKIIYRANSIEELNLMETLFIKAGKQYSGDKECWNIASGGDGGNTLLYMNEEEHEAFCEKSRGSNNGMYNKGFLITGEKMECLE